MADISGERAFYYVDGIPTKGVWVSLEDADEDSIKEELAEAGLIPRDDEEEDQNTGTPVYGGDLLVACVEGDIAPHFLSKYDCFDLSGFTEVAEFLNSRNGKTYTTDAISAYLDYAGSWSQSGFEEAYYGEAENEVKFAEQLMDDTGDLREIPVSLQMYFDYEKYARDLFVNDFYFSNGQVFRRN